MRPPWVFLVCLALAFQGIVFTAHGTELDKQSAALWQSAAREQAQLEAERPLLRNDKLEAYLDGVLKGLWRQASTHLPPMRLRIIGDPAEQAFTYPNGVCYLTTGMLAYLQCEDQLAMILAHEMAHYLGQHTLRAWDHLNTNPEEPLSAGWVERAATGTGSAPDFYLSMELEADARGLGWMETAGYCPARVIPLLQSMTGGGPEAGGLAGHGANARLRALRRLIGAGISAPDCGGSDTRRLVYNSGIAPALIFNTREAIQRGMWQRAGKDLARYCEVCPVDAEILFIRGELLRRGKVNSGAEAAIEAYQQAIGLDRDFAPAYRALGMMHYKQGRKNRAKSYFEHFLALSPNSP
ncbi:MAG: M48 family metalloprotease, partial [Desulfosarcinaceae bacterium]